MLFHKFFLLTRLALLLIQRLELKQARIVREPQQSLLYSVRRGLKIFPRKSIFDFVGELLQISAAGFLFPSRGGQLHQCGNFGTGGVYNFGLLQHVKGGRELARGDIFAGFIQEGLQLFLPGLF